MLDAHRHDFLQTHLAEVTFRLGDILRGARSAQDLRWHVSTLLVNNACLARASSTPGGPPPPVTIIPEVHLSEHDEATIASVLELESRWLSENSDLWPAYGNELLRTTSGRWAPEVLTSYALQQVVEAVLEGASLPQTSAPFSVLDIACGGATLLATTATVLDRTTDLAGQDISGPVLTLARQSLYLSGYHARLAQQDVLARDAFAGETFDLVLADTPVGLAWKQELLGDDARFSLGYPRASDASFLFLQALLAKIKPVSKGGGLAIMFTGTGLLAGGSGEEHAIRQKLMDLDILQAVISLPEGLSMAHKARMHALVLNTAKSKTWRGKTQMVDLRGQFETALLGPERRQLSRLALQEITRSMKTSKSSAHTRTLTREQFGFRRTAMRLVNTRVGFVDMARKVPSFTVPVPVGVTEDIDAWHLNRYGRLGAPPEVVDQSNVEVNWDIDTVLPSDPGRELIKAVGAFGWPTGRMVNFVAEVDYLRSAKASDRLERIGEFRNQNRLVLPVEPHFDAAFGPVPEVIIPNRCLLLVLSPEIDESFLAEWFNSPDGRRARSMAMAKPDVSPISLSQEDLLRLIDGIVMPVPDLDTQAAFVEASRSLDAAQQRVEQLRDELWRMPSADGDIRRTTRKWLGSEDLAAWAATLPHPLSSSLQTFEAFKGDDEKAAGQLVHFWEAFASFFATYLMSSLRQDTLLWRNEVPRIREALDHGHCTFDRATLGTWRIVIERLTRLFRTQLAANDPDEVKRYAQLLGDPPVDLLIRLLNPRLVSVLGDVNALRNKLDGHGGTMNRRQAADRRAIYEEKTNELRDIVGFGWSDFRLVRAGNTRMRDSQFWIDVEVLTGPAIPFGVDQIVSGRAMEDELLHMVSETADVPLVPLLEISSSCYFYNRREPSGARFVAYSMADQNEILIKEPRVLDFLDELNTITSPAPPPDIASLS